MDIIYIRDLRIEAVVGIYEWERRIKQTVILDIDMGTNIRRAAQSDDIRDTLDYKAVSKRLMAHVGATEFGLVETLAESITDILLTEFKVPWCRLRLNKRGALRGVRDVGIVLERSANLAQPTAPDRAAAMEGDGA